MPNSTGMTVTIEGVPYSLQAKDPSEVSIKWQIFQIFFYISSIVSSFVLVFRFSDVLIVMQQNCVLNAEIFFVQSHISVMDNNVSCVIDIVHSKFDDRSCNIVMFVPVVLTTFACFFTFMFVMCGRGGAGREIPDAWRIVVPTLILNFVSSCSILYTAFIFHRGVKVFLKRIEQTWGVLNIDLNDILCLQLGGKTIGGRVSSGLITVRVTLWLLVLLWGLGLVWVILRFFFAVDFKLVQISVAGAHRPVGKTLNDDIRQNEIQDDNSDVTNESYYTAESEQRPEHTTSHSHVRGVRFNDNTQATHHYGAVKYALRE